MNTVVCSAATTARRLREVSGREVIELLTAMALMYYGLFFFPWKRTAERGRRERDVDGEGRERRREPEETRLLTLIYSLHC